MANTIANVLVGVATLAIRQPMDALASWDNSDPYVGDWCAKLYKGGTGVNGSTHVQIVPTGATRATLTAFVTGVDTNSFYYKNQAINRNWEQMEFRFENPDGNGWVELTFLAIGQAEDGLGTWEKATLPTTKDIGYYGVTELGTAFDDWALTASLTDIITTINALDGDACTPGVWTLARVRVELYEAESSVHLQSAWALIDSIEIMSKVYPVEPGSIAMGLSLSAPGTDIGYTEDGVTIEYTGDTADIEVEEETIPINRVLTKETIQITCNMAESSLYNIDKAIAGSVLSGSILTLGDGVLKTMSLRIQGTNPAGYIREIILPKVTATGVVGMAYKKGEKTVVPVTFQALKPTAGHTCTIVDNAA